MGNEVRPQRFVAFLAKDNVIECYKRSSYNKAVNTKHKTTYMNSTWYNHQHNIFWSNANIVVNGVAD